MDEDDSSSLLLPSPTTTGDDDDDDAAVKPRKVTRRRRAMDGDSLFVIISVSFSSVSSLMEAMTECRDVDGPRVREGTATRKDSTTSYITVTRTKLIDTLIS
jgi:hypothetical protein